MKKETTSLVDYDFSDDYKLSWSEIETIKNYESRDGWLYLGADAVNPNFARVGITMGNLGSRSYSSANPNYYLFCAFKCKHDLSEAELKSIEDDILAKLQNRYINNDGSTKRARFYESGFISDCFFDVDFRDFYVNLHFEIYENHRNKFITCGWDDGFGGTDGEFVDCIFNRKIKNLDEFRQMIIQYD